METYDIIMLVVLGGATFFGFIKGFAWQVASLASLVLSYTLALRFADALAPQLNADPRLSKYLAMLLIYCGTSLAVWLGFRVVSGTIDRIRLREFDRQMGGLFGLAKGALFCTIVTFFAVTLSEASRAAVLKSKSGSMVAQLLHKATPVMPPELAQTLDPYIKQLDKGLDPTQTVEHPQLPQLPNVTIPGVSLPNVQLPGGSSPAQPAFPPAPQYNPYGQAPPQPGGVQPNPYYNGTAPGYNSGALPVGAPVYR